ncbi:MAG: hypothetical protein JRI23_09830, partial [Deltaproteobacteria bacterium]|nr:hypothetical protein [Deltaproteobacteria bacterium]MBW2531967.1 hypothetical protein [Deltaproteobacteria bacterium]
MIRHLTAATPALLLGLVVAACSADIHHDASNDPAAESGERGLGPGKADAPGSCRDGQSALCGGKGLGECYCDDQCEQWGDCCADYEATCTEAGCDPNL